MRDPIASALRTAKGYGRRYADGGDITEPMPVPEGESWEPPPEPLEAGYPEPQAPPQNKVLENITALSRATRGAPPPSVPAPQGGQSLTEYHPTAAENIGAALAGEHGERRHLAEGLIGNAGIGETGGLLGWTPVGQALQAQQGLEHGNAQEAALAVMPGAKGASGVAKKAAKGLLDLPAGTAESWLKEPNSQLGSNPGSMYHDPTGQSWYIKTPLSEDHAKNEKLASELYKLAGVPTADVHLTEVGGKTAVASPIIPGQTLNKYHPDNYDTIEHLQGGFPADAWLANYDSVGTGKDNIVVNNGSAHRIDMGGSLRYRAQGKPKDFGPEVGEFESMTKPGHNGLNNYDAADVFGQQIGPQQMAAQLATAQRIADVSNEEIAGLVKKYGPNDIKEQNKLAVTIAKRRDQVADQYGVQPSAAAEPPSKNNVIPLEPKEEWTPKDSLGVMKLNKMSTPTEMVHAVMNHQPVDAFKNKKLTSKQLDNIKANFDKASPKELTMALADLSPQQQMNVKSWMGKKSLDSLKVSQAEAEPTAIAEMLLAKHDYNTQKIAKSLYNLANEQSGELADHVFQKLPPDMHADVSDAIQAHVDKKGFDPWVDKDKGERQYHPQLTEQEQYEAKQDMQDFHQASLASGQTTQGFQVGKGVQFSKHGPLPDSAFHMIDWQQYEPRLTHGLGQEPKLRNITKQQAEKLGFNTKFTMLRGEKSSHGANYYDPYPTKFIDPKNLNNEEKAFFGADITPVAEGYASTGLSNEGDFKHLVGEYVYRAPTGKVAEVNWNSINHYAGYSHTTMKRLIEEGNKRDLDMIVAHGISDVGHHNHTQYIILRPEGLRSLEAKFGKDKLHMMYPHLSVAGGFLGTAIVTGQQGKEQQYARGGTVKVAKPSVNYSKGMQDRHCGICQFYHDKTCSKVLGPIDWSMWCRLYKAKGK